MARALTPRGRGLRLRRPAILLIVVALSTLLQSAPHTPHRLASRNAAAQAAAGQGDFAISNGYWSITGSGAAATVATDPTGAGAVTSTPLKSLRLGGGAADATAAWTRSGNSLTVTTHAGGADRSFTTDTANQSPAIYAVNSDPVQPGHSLGQTFTATAGRLVSISIPVYTYGATDAVMGSATLRHDGPGGALIAETDNIAVRDGDYITLAAPNLAGGVYYAELANSNKAVAWPKVAPAYLNGEGYADGVAQPATDRYLNVNQRDLGTAVILTYTLDGAQMRMDYTVAAPSGGTAVDPGVELDSPWVMSGYGLAAADGVGVARFVSDSGQYLGAAQFKRDNDRIMQDYYAMAATAEMRIDGTGPTDVRVDRSNVVARWAMTADTLTTRITPAKPTPQPDGSMVGTVMLQAVASAGDAALGDQFPEFVAADAGLARDMTSLFRERGFSFIGSTFTDLRAWMGLERDWTANKLARDERAQLLADQMDPSGYVWSWPTQQGWPWLPSPASILEGDAGQRPPTDFSTYDSRHFTSNSNFLMGSAQYWAWTHDTDFLARQTPRVQAALNYLLSPAPTGLAGQDGLITTDEAHDAIRNHDGVPGPGSAGSNWWDGLPYGNLDGYANLYFYQALESAAQLDEANGNTASATAMRTLRSTVRSRYTQTFWNDAAGRFVQTVAKNGTVYDFGSVYLNLEAVAAGLADASQSQRIWKWLDGATSSGKSDTFTRWVFAPRSDTVHNDTWWDWVFLYYFGPVSGSFDAQVEDGGAAIYLAYYEIMARLQSNGIDNAYSRFAQVIDRYRKPDHLAGGSPLYYGETQQHLYPGSVATDTPFPEGGLAASSFLNGFLGIQADATVLHINPHLPQHGTTVDQSIYTTSVTGVKPTGSTDYAALPWAGVRNASYRGAMLNINEAYCNAVLDNVTVDVASRPAAQWPLLLSVGGFGPTSVVSGAAAEYDAASSVWTLTVAGPGTVAVQAAGCPGAVIPEAPVAALLPLAALVLYTARRRVSARSLLRRQVRRR